MDTCLNCNQPVSHFSSGKPKKFCSAECSRRYSAKVAKKKKAKKKKHEHITYLVQCENCFDVYEAKNKSGRFCSRKCQLETQKKNGKFTKICPYCETEFTTNKGEQVFCTQKCNSANNFKNANEKRKQEAIEQQYQHIPRHIFPTNRARQSYLRRKRTREQWVEDVKVEVLIERDKGICQLCGTPVRLDVHYTHPLAPTRDHIIPLSLGGEHSYANCQLACRDCNTDKNNRVEVNLLDKTKQKRKSIAPKITDKRRNQYSN